MDEACTADKVETIRAFGYPELSVRCCARSLLGRPLPDILGSRQRMANDIAFLTFDRTIRLLCE
ncbi:hypothetical protein D3C86_1986790 [compost metagenome]